jgi:hypothetical protein
MSVPEPSVRIEILQRSQRCLVYGVLSLLPIVGLPLAALALSQHWRVKARGGNDWNPARNYLWWGCFLGSWGAGFSSLAAVILGFSIASQ